MYRLVRFIVNGCRLRFDRFNLLYYHPRSWTETSKTLLLFSRYAFVLQMTRVHCDVLSVSVNSPILIATYNW